MISLAKNVPSAARSWSSEVVGQLTFRGNPTRSYYGLGPVPEAPEILWRYPESGGTNDSAIHWDMVCNLRLGGSITVDGAELQRDGQFLV